MKRIFVLGDYTEDEYVCLEKEFPSNIRLYTLGMRGVRISEGKYIFPSDDILSLIDTLLIPDEVLIRALPRTVPYYEGLIKKLKARGVKTVTVPFFDFLIPRMNVKVQKKDFALMLSDGNSLSLSEIKEIINKTSLSPLFFRWQGNSKTDKTNRYIRFFGASQVTVGSLNDFNKLTRNVAFAITDCSWGIIPSILSHTPLYVDARESESRRLISTLMECVNIEKILTPFSKNITDKINKVGANSSDFEYVINTLKKLTRGYIRERI